MKLIRHNKENCASVRSGMSTIRINESGLLSFSWTLYQHLNPEEKDEIYVEFLQDEESPEDWYIALSDEQRGFKLRGKKSSKTSMFNCSSLTKRMLEHVKQPGDAAASYKLRVIEEPKQLSDGLKGWLIITKPIK
jgi:hypothetical protein